MIAPTLQFTITVNPDNADAFAALVASHLRAGRSQSADGDIIDAKSSGLTEYEFRRAIRTGALAAAKVGRRYVVRRAALDAYLAKNRVTPASRAAKPAAGDEFDAAVARGGKR